MDKLSTQHLNLIPNPVELQSICKSISALEAIICPEWEFRYYSYQKDWSENEEFCEMRNGQGDQMLILFSNEGTCINGFAHESEMNSWKKIERHQKKSIVERLLGTKKEPKIEFVNEIQNGIVDDLPEVFKGFIFGEPVKSIGTTFCIWQTKSDKKWQTGKIVLPENDFKDGSSDLLQLLDGNPLTYKQWAEEYYEEEFEERELKLELVEQVYNQAILTNELVKSINPTLENIKKLKSELEEIGYQNDL